MRIYLFFINFLLISIVSLHPLSGHAQTIIEIKSPVSIRARALSDNGHVVIGDITTAEGQERPFRWTKETGVLNLGTLGV